MRIARTVLPAGAWPPGSEAGAVTLAYDDRFRRRLRLEAGAAGPVLLDLPQARVLRDGDALRLDDGALIAVSAAHEPLMEVRARDAALLMRLAWHIGNRHLPARLEAARILLRRDHVIAAMLTGLGGDVIEVMAPFDPEGGAYGEAGTQAHSHSATHSQVSHGEGTHVHSHAETHSHGGTTRSDSHSHTHVHSTHTHRHD